MARRVTVTSADILTKEEFAQEMLRQADQATHSLSVGPLIRQARQQRCDRQTIKQLKVRERELTKQVKKAEAQAKKAEEKARKAEARARAKGKYVSPEVSSRPMSFSTGKTAAYFAKPGETYEEALRRVYKECGLDYDRDYVACTSSSKGSYTPPLDCTY